MGIVTHLMRTAKCLMIWRKDNITHSDMGRTVVCIWLKYQATAGELFMINLKENYRCGTTSHRIVIWSHFYQTRSAWSVDQGSNQNHSPAYNFAPTVTKFCVMWEGLSLPQDTKFGNCRCKIVDSRSFPSWSLIHGLRWSGLIKAEPD